jgi:hypothetical protein
MTTIKPVIEGTEISSVEVGRMTLRLKQKVGIENLKDIIGAVEDFAKFFDLASISSSEEEEEGAPWEDSDLIEFLSKETREDQIAALKVMSDKGEVNREQFIEEMKKALKNPGFRGWDLGGLLAGITIRSHSWGCESPYIKDERREGNDWNTFYSINEKYAPLVKKWLKERGE